MSFSKAVKAKQKLRLAVDGVSGSGKTYTALAIASGMGGKIAVIDSEHGSSELYADRFSFDVLKLTSFQIEDYGNALSDAAKEGYDICIIDSTSHAWDALVERVERIASQKFSGNTFRAWGEGTPLQHKLVEAMLSFPGHLIVTCRSKTEYSVDKNDKGQTIIRKVGTAAVQRQGFEYEFTMAMTMDSNHVGLVTKDRTGKYQDSFMEKPGEKFGSELVAWLNEGAEIIDKTPEPPAEPEKPEPCPAQLKAAENAKKIAASGKTGVDSDTKKRLWTESKGNELVYWKLVCTEQDAILAAPAHQETTAEGNGDLFGDPTREIIVELENWIEDDNLPSVMREDIRATLESGEKDVRKLRELLVKVIAAAGQ